MTKLNGLSDLDYPGDVDDRKSTSGYLFMIGDSAIAWSTKKNL